jgi:hypothetical protein
MTSRSSTERATGRRRFLAAIALAGLAGGAMARADIVDELNAMADSIDVWLDSQPAAWIAPADTLDLSGLFPGATLRRDAETDRLEVRLPRYLDLIDTGLDLDLSAGVADTAIAASWRLPLECRGDTLRLDGRPTPCGGCADAPALVETIGRRLTWLRTLGLPRNLAAPAPTNVDTSGSLELRMHPTRRWESAPAAVGEVLAHLARGRQIYAGLLSCDATESGLLVRTFALLTHPEMEGHHFLVYNDRTRPDGETAVEVLLIPFIRTDNLDDLFARPPAAEDPSFEVRIRR